MKPILILFIVCLLVALSNSLRAQTMFAPPGSEWYHDMAEASDGVFHSYYDGNDTIRGIPCRKIARVAETREPWYGYGLRVHDLSSLYVYNNADTVFVYNDYFGRFTPLYVFNVHDGDTVKLPVLPLDGYDLEFFSGIDSTFSFIVDSVRMKLYDTAMLKTVFMHTIGNATSEPYTDYVYNYVDYEYFEGDTTGMYAERIGTVAGGIMPWGAPSINFADESDQGPGVMRCYHDTSLSVKITTDICGIPAPGSVGVLPQQALSVYPNPANDVLTIEYLPPNATIDIADVAGRRVYGPTNASNGSVALPVGQLPNGMYMLKITNADGITERRKITVIH